MQIRKLDTWQEWLESDRITSTAFLHKWDEKKAEEELRLMSYPADSGSCSIHIEDDFLPENTGTYAVKYENGKAILVERMDAAADLEVTEQTFCQLVLGIITPGEAVYREGTKINSNQEILERFFVRKTVCG